MRELANCFVTPGKAACKLPCKSLQQGYYPQDCQNKANFPIQKLADNSGTNNTSSVDVAQSLRVHGTTHFAVICAYTNQEGLGRTLFLSPRLQLKDDNSQDKQHMQRPQVASKRKESNPPPKQCKHLWISNVLTKVVIPDDEIS